MTPKSIFYFLLLVGLGFYAYSTRLDFYTDTKAKEKLDSEASEKLGGDDYEKFKIHYYETVDKLKTNKVAFWDFGTGLAMASATILLFLYWKKVKSFSDFKSVTSLSRIKLFIFANLVWLLLIPGTYWYYSFRGQRGDFPWFADSIGIPIFTQTPVYFFALIPLNIFIWLTSIKSNLPTTIFIRPTFYDRKEILKETFWSFLFLLNLLFLYGFVLDGDHFSVPVNLFFTFVLLNLRAGQIFKPIPNELG